MFFKMKRIIVLLLILLPITLLAQRQRNYVYIFDCTESMERDNHIWEPAKQFMKEDIEQLDENANVTIVLFHQSTSTPIRFKAKVFSWKDIEATCDRMFKESKRTGICNAWDFGLKYIDRNRNNYLYLFTDGIENVHSQRTDAVCQRIKNWCNQAPNNFAFFVALGKEMKNKPEVKKLIEATKSCDRAFFVDNKHPAPFGAFDRTSFNVNCHSLRELPTGFSDYGTFDASVECQDEYYSIKLKDGKIKEGKAIFILKQNKQPSDNYQIHFKIKANPEVLNICNPDIYVNIDTRDLANLDMGQPSGVTEGQYDAGQAETYPSFLFWKGKDTDVVKADLSAIFNEQAKKQSCSLKVSLKLPSEIKGKCSLYYNGEKIDHSFIIKATDKESIIDIKVPHELAQKDFVIGLKGKSDNLETINAEESKGYESSIYFEHEINWNPLQTILLWLSILILALFALWFVLLKSLLYPKIRLSRLELSSKKGYYVNKKINGVRRVVVTNKRKEQNLLNKLFTGEVLYIVNEIWTSPWELLPKGRKKVAKIKLHGKYMITPVTLELANYGEYQLANIETKETITIKIL